MAGGFLVPAACLGVGGQRIGVGALGGQDGQASVRKFGQCSQAVSAGHAGRSQRLWARLRVLLLTMAAGEPGRQMMREARAQELGSMTGPLVDLIRLASTAMGLATAALFSTDPSATDSVAAAYETVSALRHELEDHAAWILELRSQARVAELPTTITAVLVNAEAERMGQLAWEAADIARTRRAWASIPAPLLVVLRELSEGCLDAAAKAADVLQSHTSIGAVELTEGGHDVNRLLDLLYQQLLSSSDAIDVGAAIDLTLAARCYERFAGHAKAVAQSGSLLAVAAPRG